MVERRDVFGASLDLETLLAHAVSADKSLRWAAAIELGELESDEAAICLWRLRDDNDENVRIAAENAIKRFDRSVLERALNAENAKLAILQHEEVFDEDEDGFEPFRPWKIRPLDPPTAENDWAVAAAINDIVSTEGPITGSRLLNLYGQAAFPNAPKKISKYRIRQAIESLIRRRILQRSDLAGPDELEQWVLNRVGDREVVVRHRGSRTYAEIPVSEVMMLIHQRMGFASNQSADRKFKVVMDAYGIQQRELHILGALFEKEWASLLT